uniref:Transmembrane protein n=1 Tax=Caenorhabditis tropicalis TaxID=1561998 RepID=A0A1I7UY19_9PELO
MPIITFVVGYVYLVFGSFKVFNSLGFEFVLSCFSTSILTIIATWHVMGIAKSLSENMANTSPFWHSVAASCFILLDVILMVHHWEIAGLDDWENPVQEQRNINDPEDSLIEDLHMD